MKANLLLISSIIKNSIELIDDAEILYEKKKIKRAFFLCYTAYEEIVKAREMIEKSTPIQELNRHEKKQEVAQRQFERLKKDEFIVDSVSDSKILLEGIDSLLKDLKEKEKLDPDLFNTNEIKEGRTRLILSKKEVKKRIEGLTSYVQLMNVLHLRNHSLYISGYATENIDIFFFDFFYHFLRGYQSHVVKTLYSKHPLFLKGITMPERI